MCPAFDTIKYTVNGKRVEVAVKKIINGAAPGSLNTRYLKNTRNAIELELIMSTVVWPIQAR